MNNRQFVACKFRSSDARTYTYHNDGEPLAIGDKARVEAPRDEGWVTVEVVAITEAPTFPTKPIIEKAPEPSSDDVQADQEA